MQSRADNSAPAPWQALWTDRLRAASLAVSILGLVNAGYLAWTKLFNTNIYCGPGSTACDAVSASTFGYVAGIPVSYLGFGTYLVLIALLALEDWADFLKTNGPILVFGLTLFGTLFSGYLQYASIFQLKEICPYCVLNAVTIATLFVLSIFRLRRALDREAA